MKFSKQGRTDGKQHFEIRFGIPLALIRPFEQLAYQYRKWKYWLNPDRCACCNKKMYVRYYQIEHIFDNGRRLLVENHPFSTKDNKRGVVCPDCIAEQLKTNEWTPRFTHGTSKLGGTTRFNYRFWSTKKCDITGNDVRSYKDVEIYPYIDMTFCTNAWNHSYISKEAVIECVEKGTIRTSSWGIVDRKMMAPMNHKRLFINGRGELL